MCIYTYNLHLPLPILRIFHFYNLISYKLQKFNDDKALEQTALIIKTKWRRIARMLFQHPKHYISQLSIFQAEMTFSHMLPRIFRIEHPIYISAKKKHNLSRKEYLITIFTLKKKCKTSYFNTLSYRPFTCQCHTFQTMAPHL